MFDSSVRVYDGRGEYGTYLHSTWIPWSDRETHLSTWLWVGSANDPAGAVQSAAQEVGTHTQVVLTTPELHKRIADLRASAGTERGQERRLTLWHAALAARLEANSELQQASLAALGRLPDTWALHTAGDFGLGLQRLEGGLAVVSLFDLQAARELLALRTPPLFTLHLRSASGNQETVIAADVGWKQARIDQVGDRLTLRWAEPTDTRLHGIVVIAHATPDAKAHAWRWSLRVENHGNTWGVMRVAFPQVALAAPGDHPTALYPLGPGQVNRTLWDYPFSRQSVYPTGWCTMQFMAVYGDGPQSSGLYFGMHDPWGGTKEIGMESDPTARSVRLRYDIPAPNMGQPGNGFLLDGQAVWQLLRGDWFDAALIYKTWARQEARWWPTLTTDGRADTPLWMRELCVWANAGGFPNECAPAVKQMASTLGVPLGFHWYNWHAIPFDNDYPHYFPTKPGVAESVKDLQASNVYVMPYINGRLWDTRDHGIEEKPLPGSPDLLRRNRRMESRSSRPTVARRRTVARCAWQ